MQFSSLIIAALAALAIAGPLQDREGSVNNLAERQETFFCSCPNAPLAKEIPCSVPAAIAKVAALRPCDDSDGSSRGQILGL
jgi:hypothetical protein